MLDVRECRPGIRFTPYNLFVSVITEPTSGLRRLVRRRVSDCRTEGGKGLNAMGGEADFTG